MASKFDFPPPRGDWFSLLFGFSEPRRMEDTRRLFRVETDSESGTKFLTSLPTGRVFEIGKFSTPSLDELRARASAEYHPSEEPQEARFTRLKLSVVQGDVQMFHGMSQNRLATFQVASQFNCLEFPHPGVTPEAGITGYASDRTQGPACCVCAGPAVVYRNYFVFDGGQPQTRDRQIDNLEDVTSYVHTFGVAAKADEKTKAAGLRALQYWTCKNGYTDGVSANLQRVPWDEIDGEKARSLLRVGIHEDVEVTAAGGWGRDLLSPSGGAEGERKLLVTQVFCSGLAISYSNTLSDGDWEPLAKIVLDSCYEATLFAALEAKVRHASKHGSNRVFLTMIGGGVFGNKISWICDAIRKACLKFRHVDLQVFLVSYGSPDGEMLALLDESKTW